MIRVLYNGKVCDAIPALGMAAMGKCQCYYVLIGDRRVLVGVHELDIVKEGK